MSTARRPHRPTVRKIGYGQTSIVNIITTSSGVYSSDALTSPHVLYPGIHVEQVPYDGAMRRASSSSRPLAGSFVSIVRTPSAVVIQRQPRHLRDHEDHADVLTG